LRRDRASGQAVRFVIVGLTNTIVDLGFFYVFTLTGMPHLAAKTISYILGICNSFIWNKFWTFGARHSGRTAQEFGLFFLVNLPPLIVNIVVFGLLGFWATSGLAAQMGKAFIAAVVAVVWNFLGSRYLAFRHTALKKDESSETDTARPEVEKGAVDKHALKTDDHA
jgi:putative flippase GtrA